ncbi:MAG: ABC transporter permease, partial [Clostridiales Family XIII bacterium]|nr:ABC transporter permease [Clostridiales Family XIII bacterium]
ALLSDLHKIDKALLQALLFFVVAATLTMAYGVSSAADEAVAEVRRGIGGSVLATRAGALPDPLDKGSGYPYSVAKGLGASKYVKGSSFYVCVNGAETGSIKGIPVVSSSMFALFPDWEGLGRLQIVGATETESEWGFVDRGLEILEGRGIRPEDEGRPYAVISKRMADHNLIGIGSSFEVGSYLYPGASAALEVIGIHSGEDEGSGPDYLNACNTVYTPVSAAAGLNGGSIMQAAYDLYDPADMDAFIADAEGLFSGAGADMAYERHELDFLLASAALRGITKSCSAAAASITVVAAVLAGMAALYLMLGRMREIGILLSLGETKLGILGQMAVEALLPAVLAMALGVCAGAPIGAFITERALGGAVPGWAPGAVAAAGAAGAWAPISAAAGGVPAVCASCLLLFATSLAASASRILRYSPAGILRRAE